MTAIPDEWENPQRAANVGRPADTWAAGWPAAILLAVGLWLCMAAAALLLRPLLPVDETRYLAVAWEMWSGGHWLVPRLNGELYGHKPPLLFWLFHLGWAFFGVNEVWPRAVGPLAGLTCLLLTRALGRTLWPAQPGIGDAAMLVLCSFVAWPILGGTVMFDTLLTAGVLTALLGTAWVAAGRALAGWSLFAGGLVLGFFAKGPAVLPFLACIPLFGPLWAGAVGKGGVRIWWRWWSGAALAGIAAVAGIALWVVPAVLTDGVGYAFDVVRDQAAGRMTDSADHGRAWWWYAIALPPALLPAIAWTTPWLRRKRPCDSGERFCLIWSGGALLLLSLVSGKQIHYLLPALPAVALLIARHLADIAAAPTQARRQVAGPVLFCCLAGIAIAALPWLPLDPEILADVAPLATGWGWALAGVGLLALLPATSLRRQVAVLAGLATTIVLIVHLAAAPLLAARFDVRPLGERLGLLEREGRAIAHYGTYHGQFHFAGRLQRPIAEIGDADAVAWMASHPNGIVVTYQEAKPLGGMALFAAAYRGGWATVWDLATASADPALIRRR